MTAVKPPIPDRDDAWFWAAAREHRLLLQRCGDCGTLRHPPTPMCGHCGSLDLDTVEATGRGTIHSWVVSHHPTQPDAEPRIVVLVDLEEGVRLVSNLVDTPADAVENEQAVEVCFVEYDSTGEGTVVLPQFRLATTAAAAR